jgi:hypothetical protein
LLQAAPGARADAPGAEVVLEVSPAEATVGERLQAALSVVLPSDVRLETAPIGPSLGAFAVDSGSWSGPQPEAGRQRWTWTGALVSFRTGELELPSVRISFERADGRRGSAESPPRTVLIRSVIDPRETAEGGIPELADLKAPASLEPDYSALWTASGLLALLLAAAAVVWWLQRRYAAKLVRVAMPEDPFRRTPPHVWVHEELQSLLDRRLPERDEVDLFFAELSRIVKLYLGGRYRVELMERTSGEVPGVLTQAGTPVAAIGETARLLARADAVKFAGEWPDPEGCRRAVESAYGIVDATMPREAVPSASERGAA